MGTRGTVGFAFLVLLLVVTGSLLASRNAGAEEIRESVLPGCGIAYPGGYDVNTVGSMRGKLLAIEVPEDGPVRFLLASEGERWVVLTSPAWFWRMTEMQLAPGDSVVVRGSKTLGADGTLYLIAQEIRLPESGSAVLVRDRRGAPLWGGGNRGGGISGGVRGDGRGEGFGHNNTSGKGRR